MRTYTCSLPIPHRSYEWTGEKAYAKYSIFSVGNEYQKYKLTVGGYSGTAGKIM